MWDVLHYGHLNFFRNASMVSDYLVVGICSDSLASRHKGSMPYLSEEERKELISMVKQVDDVYIYDKPDYLDRFREYGCSLFIVGDEFGNQGVPEHGEVLESGLPVIRLPRTPYISSTFIKESIA